MLKNGVNFYICDKQDIHIDTNLDRRKVKD